MRMRIAATALLVLLVPLAPSRGDPLPENPDPEMMERWAELSPHRAKVSLHSLPRASGRRTAVPDSLVHSFTRARTGDRSRRKGTSAFLGP